MSEAGKYFFRAAMCGGGVHSILLFVIVTRCLKTMDVCIWRIFVFCVCCSGNVGMFVV